MTDANAIIQNLLQANPLREPTLRTIIQALQLPAGSRGLDAGCGIGLQALLLEEAVGPGGHITGLDILTELLAYGEELVAKAGMSDRITFQTGDVGCLPFEEDSFDWIWSADCIGYPAGELAQVLKELSRIVKPGGSVILVGWSSQQLLPGYPLLEARLNANCSGYIPFFQGKSPESNFMRALSAFRELGFESIEGKTFAGDIHAPLSSEESGALVSLFEMLWGTPQPDVSTQDWVMYKRLCTPGSADFILDIPDYYAFFTYSMFRGRYPKNE